MFTKMELFGVRAANFTHRRFVDVVLIFIAYNIYTFVSNYNAYWRLRRDPNIPKQWLEDQENAVSAQDEELERQRVDRESRMIGKFGLKDKKYYD